MYSEPKDQGLRGEGVGGAGFEQFSTSFLTDNPPGENGQEGEGGISN